MASLPAKVTTSVAEVPVCSDTQAVDATSSESAKANHQVQVSERTSNVHFGRSLVERLSTDPTVETRKSWRVGSAESESRAWCI